MTTNGISLPQRRQPSQATIAKAKRLDVLMLTKTVALIEGDHDQHLVWLDTLECSCRAGQAGITCSHALRAAEARPRPRQYARFNPTTGMFDVMEGTTVVGQVRSYLEMERSHA